MGFLTFNLPLPIIFREIRSSLSFVNIQSVELANVFPRFEGAWIWFLETCQSPSLNSLLSPFFPALHFKVRSGGLCGKGGVELQFPGWRVSDSIRQGECVWQAGRQLQHAGLLASLFCLQPSNNFTSLPESLFPCSFFGLSARTAGLPAAHGQAPGSGCSGLSSLPPLRLLQASPINHGWEGGGLVPLRRGAAPHPPSQGFAAVAVAVAG